MQGRESLVRAYGFREVAAGMLSLSIEKKAVLWSRFAGDGLDIATLMAGLRDDNPKKGALPPFPTTRKSAILRSCAGVSGGRKSNLSPMGGRLRSTVLGASRLPNKRSPRLNGSKGGHYPITQASVAKSAGLAEARASTLVSTP
jgi:hypothetical protein